MNRENFNVLFDSIVERSKSVLVNKRNEYANNVNVFSNFDNATGLSFHTTNVGVAWEYLVKHLQSLKDIISSIEEGRGIEKITPTLLDEKMGDIINYFILIEGMLREKIKEVDV